MGSETMTERIIRDIADRIASGQWPVTDPPTPIPSIRRLLTDEYGPASPLHASISPLRDAISYWRDHGVLATTPGKHIVVTRAPRPDELAPGRGTGTRLDRLEAQVAEHAAAIAELQERLKP